MIALATRGYIWPRFGQLIIQVGEGPDIVAQRVLQPSLSGSVVAEEGPTISGTATPGPTIAGGSREETQLPEPPTISGGNKPKIG